MNLTQIRVIIAIIATLIAIIFIMLSYLFPKDSILILAIEVILLPAIYIIGNYLAENLIESHYKKVIRFVTEESDNLHEKYIKERLLNIKLKTKLEFIKKNAKKKN